MIKMEDLMEVLILPKYFKCSLVGAEASNNFHLEGAAMFVLNLDEGQKLYIKLYI
jgi:hypothetical protein